MIYHLMFYRAIHSPFYLADLDGQATLGFHVHPGELRLKMAIRFGVNIIAYQLEKIKQKTAKYMHQLPFLWLTSHLLGAVKENWYCKKLEMNTEMADNHNTATNVQKAQL